MKKDIAMTNDEKAKAYDEALERARKVHRNYKNLFPEDSYSEDIEEIFPQLRESEDERIRKKIIEHLEMIKMGCVICTIDTSEEIAWLEKQEQKPAECIEDSVKFEEGFKVGRESGLRDGQKYVLNNLDSYGLCKPAWSEEDERLRLACIATINDVIDYERDRWEDYNPGKPFRPITKYDEQIDWLKSLPMRCPKTSDNWKPTEEQMEALAKASGITKTMNCGVYSTTSRSYKPQGAESISENTHEQPFASTHPFLTKQYDKRRTD